MEGTGRGGEAAALLRLPMDEVAPLGQRPGGAGRAVSRAEEEEGRTGCRPGDCSGPHNLLTARSCLPFGHLPR